MKNGPRVNSFFSGIGGFDTAFEQVGFNLAFQCELDPFCIDVLSHHWPKVRRAQDIADVLPSKLPAADVWVGGFPCQDVSVARGHLGRAGLRGERSGLFFEFADLIKARRPRVLLIENVTGLLNSHNGRDFAVVLDRLCELGYGVAWRVFNSRYFGAPQSRPRVYICAWHGRPDLASKAIHEVGPAQVLPREREAFLAASRVAPRGVRVPQMAYCLAATSGRHTGTDWSRTYVSYHSAVRRLTPIECERLQGFDDDWTVPTTAGLSKDQIDSLRYHALGNAVSVPVVKWIANRIHGLLSERGSRKQKSVRATPKALAARLLDLHPSFRGVEARISGEQLELARLASSDGAIRWKSAGVAFHSVRVDVALSPAPRRLIPSDLGSIVEHPVTDPRYFLSANAAEGILRRVSNQNRRLFSGLSEALTRLAATDRAKVRTA